MHCRDVRDNGCDQELRPNWRYCPKCGSLTGKVTLERRDPFAVPPGQRSVRSVPIGYRGMVAVPVRSIEVLGGDREAFSVPSTLAPVAHPTALDIEVSPIATGGAKQLTVRLHTVDGERSEGELWEPDVPRNLVVDLKATAADDARIVCEPAAIILHQGLRERPFRIRNAGGQPLHLGLVTASEGYEVTGDRGVSGIRLEPDSLKQSGRSYADFIVRRTNPNSTGGRLIVKDLEDEVVQEFPILQLPSAGVALKSRFIVGLDFGTSNTSVFVRDTKTGSVQALGESERFPTAIYCPSTDPSEWLYGEAAIREDDLNPGKGLLVRELKNSLRNDEEPALPYATKSELLAWYLRQLLQRSILPALDILSEGTSTRVQFLFSLPVLDGGPQQRRQIEAMEAAWKAAGFEEHGRVETEWEPVCGALYLLNQQRRGALVLNLNDGDNVLVFDSGGGTTDIAFGPVKIGGNTIGFPEPVEVGSHTDPKTGSMVQFGGSVLTRDLGKLSVNPSNQAAYMSALARLNEQHGTHFAAFDPADEPVDGRDPRPWYRRFPRFYRLVEDAKIRLSNEGEESVAILPGGPGGIPPILATQKALTVAVDERMRQVLGSMLAQLPKGEDGRSHEPRYVIPIGGNSRIAKVVAHLKGPFPPPKTVELPSDERFMAVPRGTVFAVDPTVKTMPYSLRIDLENGETGHRFRSDSLVAVPKWSQPIHLPPETPYTLKVVAEIDGREETLQTIEFVNETSDPQVYLSARIEREGDRELLLVGSDATGQTKDTVRYEI